MKGTIVRRLQVYCASSKVGVLEDKEGTVTFRYAPSWLEAVDRFPVSISLPLRREPHGEAACVFRRS